MVRAGAGLVLVVAVIACGGGDDEAGVDATGEPDVASATIGPEGGVIRLDGFLLSVPSGALATPTELTVRRTTEPAGDVDAVSPVFRLEPDGLVFRRPVGVAIRTPAGADPQLFWSDADDVLRGHAGTRGPDHVAATGRHFSRVVAGVRLPCGFPSLTFSLRALDGDALRAAQLVRLPERRPRIDVVTATLAANGALSVEAFDTLTAASRGRATIPSSSVIEGVRIGEDGTIFVATAAGVDRCVYCLDADIENDISDGPIRLNDGVSAMATGDFDEDGASDVAVISGAPRHGIEVRSSGGASYSTPSRSEVVGAVPVALAVLDFNGDGRDDLLVTGGGAGAVSAAAYPGRGDGTFDPPQPVLLGAIGASVAVAMPDAIFVEPRGTSASFASLAGAASEFAPASSLLVPGTGATPAWTLAPGDRSTTLDLDASGALAAFDVDGDGLRDRLAFGAQGVTVLAVAGPRALAAAPGDFREDSDGDSVVVGTSDSADGDDDVFVVGGTSEGRPAVVWARRRCETSPPIDAPPIDAPIDAPPIDAPIDAPMIDAPIDAPMIDAPIDAPPIDAPIDAPMIDAPPIDAPIDAPMIDAPIDAPINPWTLRNSGTTETFDDVVWDGARYLALTRAATLYESPDGLSWFLSNASGFEMFLVGSGLAYAPPLDRWVVLGDRSFDGRIYTSEGSTGTWTLRDSPPERTRAVIWAGPPISRFVLGTDSDIRTSPDGITWTVAAGSAGADIFDVAWAGPGNNFVAVGRFGQVYVSADATTWTPGTSATSDLLHDVTGQGSGFVAITSSTTPSVFRSIDGGATFTDVAAPFIAGCVAWTGTRYDAFLSSNGLPLQSADGAAWTSGASITGNSFIAITGGGPRIVAVGGGGVIGTREH